MDRKVGGREGAKHREQAMSCSRGHGQPGRQPQEPHGLVRWRSARIVPVGDDGPSLLGQLGGADFPGSSFAIAATQLQHDRTRQDIGDRAVELTTVDSGNSYGGQIVLDKLKPGALPQQVAITVAWDGKTFSFSFQLAPAGTPQQAFPTTKPLASPAATPIPALVPAAVPVTPEPIRVAAVSPAPSVTGVRAATARVAVLASVPVASMPIASMPITAIAVFAPLPVGGGLTEAERYQQRLLPPVGGKLVRAGRSATDPAQRMPVVAS